MKWNIFTYNNIIPTDRHKIHKKSTNWYRCSDIKEKIIEIHNAWEKKFYSVTVAWKGASKQIDNCPFITFKLLT